MTSPGHLPFNTETFDADAIRAVIAMAEGLARTIHVARVLVENGRTVDLAGLDRGVGLLCAKAFDLPPEAGRSVRPHLVALMSDAAALTAALRTDASL